MCFLVANVYHVNRQSYAFFSMQASPSDFDKSIYEWLLHTFFVIAFVIHNTYPQYKIELTFISLASLIFLSIFIMRNNKKKIYSKISFLQGFLIWLPVIWFNNIIIAFAVGISIHYLQYLVISWSVCSKSFKYSSVLIILTLISYSSMSSMSLSGIFTSNKLSILIFIPTFLQLLHFYYDSFIWKRNSPDINSILKKTI